MKHFLQTLRGRLFLLITIALLPVFGLVIHNYVRQRQVRVEEVGNEALRLAQLVARQQDQIIQEARVLLMTLARLPGVRGIDREACNSALVSVGEQFGTYTAIVLSDRAGRSLCSSVPIAEAIDSADRAWFQRALRELDFVVGGYQMGRISGKPVLVAACPVMDESGKPARVLAVSLDITWINALASQIDLPPGATVALIDGDGTVMARYPNPEVWVGKKGGSLPIVRTALGRQEEGTAVGVGLDGVRRLFAFSPLRESPNRSYGLVLIGIPEEVAFSDVDRLFRRNLAMLGLLLALSLAGTSLVSKALILRKSDAILRLAGRLADGDMAARTGLPYGSDEFGQLATALDQMAAKSEERHDALIKAGRQLQQYADIVKNIQMGLMIYQIDDAGEDRSLRLIGANPATERLLGLPAEESLIGKTIDEIFPGLRAQGIPRLFADVGRSGEAAAVEELRYGDDSVAESWWSFRAFPLPDSCVGVGFENITERKKEEEERRSLELQLQQAQKIEAIGLLAGGVAHDFNNVLTAIIGNAQLALEEVGPDSPAGKNLLQILQLSNRCSVLIRQLLTFSRPQPLTPAVVSLNTIVENTSGMLRRVIGSNIRLKFVPAATGNVLADAGQTEQVLVNLMINARDAMPRGGDLTIETADVTLDEAYASTHLEAKPGPYLMLAVSDTGHGMDRETLNRIFEPFFTTKEAGKGTGLGLSTVYGIVKQHHGSIFVYSEVGKGTTFKIYLPRVEAEIEAAAGASEEPAPRGSETILLVEDQEMVRTLVQRVLEGQGYTVLSANDADEGEELFTKNEGVSLLITDLVMPGRTGWQLHQVLCARRAGLRVLYISGYTDISVVRKGGVSEGDPFLQKPFTPSALVKKVRRILDSPQ